MSVVGTVVDQAIAKALQSSAFEDAMEQSMHKMVHEIHVKNVLATQMIGNHAFSVPVAIFVEKRLRSVLPYMPKMEGQQKKLVKEVEDLETPSLNKNSSRSSNPLRDIPDKMKTNQRVYST